MALLAHRATGELGRGGHEDVAEGENAGQDGEQTDEQELELLVDAEGADEAEQGVQVLVGLATLLQQRRYRQDLDVSARLIACASSSLGSSF